MDKEKFKAEIEESKVSTAKKLKEIKATFDSDVGVSPEIFIDQLDFVHNRIDRVFNALFSFIDEHTENHAPHPKSGAQKKKAIQAFGMEDDIEVVPKKIFANLKNNPSQQMLLDFLTKRKKTEREKKFEDYLE